MNNLLFFNSRMNEHDYSNVISKIIVSNHRVSQANIDDYSDFWEQVWSHVCPVLKKQEEELKKFISFFSKKNKSNDTESEFNSDVVTKIKVINEEFLEVVKQRVCYFKSNVDTLTDSINIRLEDYNQLKEDYKELDIRLCKIKEDIEKTKDKINSLDRFLPMQTYNKLKYNGVRLE